MSVYEDKTVTIEYDADKTTVPAIIEGFKKIRYEAKEVKTEKPNEQRWNSKRIIF